MTLTENRNKIRKEIHSRQSFAYEKGLYWFKRISIVYEVGNNIFGCKATQKWLQARRIYIHYQNEYQLCQNLPFSK